jgi:hypothetical protein
MGAWFSNAARLLKPNGKTVDKLPVRKKTTAGHDAPCLAAKEKDLGTTGNRYAETPCSSPATIPSWDGAE